MATDLHTAKLITYYAARALDLKQQDNFKNSYIMYCAMAKQYATDLAFKISDSALQLHGGYGYLKDYPIEKFFRDLRVNQILEGTNEIMRLVISKHLINGIELEPK